MLGLRRAHRDMGAAADALLAFVDAGAAEEERKLGALLIAEALLKHLGWAPVKGD